MTRRLALCTGAILLSSQTPAFGQGESEVKTNEGLLAAFISLNWFIDRDFAQLKPSELQLLAWLLSDDEFRRRLKLVSARFDNHIPLAVDDGFHFKQGDPLAAVAFSSDFAGDGRRDLSNLEWCLYCLCRGGFIEFCHQPYKAVFADHAAIKTTLSTITSEYLAEWKDAQSVLMFGNAKVYEHLILVRRLREISYAIERRFFDQLAPQDRQKLIEVVALLSPVWLYIADRVCVRYRGGSPLLGSFAT